MPDVERGQQAFEAVDRSALEMAYVRPRWEERNLRKPRPMFCKAMDPGSRHSASKSYKRPQCKQGDVSCQGRNMPTSMSKLSSSFRALPNNIMN